MRIFTEKERAAVGRFLKSLSWVDEDGKRRPFKPIPDGARREKANNFRVTEESLLVYHTSEEAGNQAHEQLLCLFHPGSDVPGVGRLVLERCFSTDGLISITFH